VVLTAGLGTVAVKEWGSNYSYVLYPQAVAWLTPQLAPGEPVMILDPPAYTYYSGGRPAVVVPNNDPRTMIDVARQYGARFIVLEPAHTRPVHELYLGTENPPELTLRTVFKNGRGKELKIYEVERAGAKSTQ
jgi:hypothetical protein